MRLVELTECCGTLFVLWPLLLSSCFLAVPEIKKLSSQFFFLYIVCPLVT